MFQLLYAPVPLGHGRGKVCLKLSDSLIGFFNRASTPRQGPPGFGRFDDAIAALNVTVVLVNRCSCSVPPERPQAWRLHREAFPVEPSAGAGGCGPFTTGCAVRFVDSFRPVGKPQWTEAKRCAEGSVWLPEHSAGEGLRSDRRIPHQPFGVVPAAHSDLVIVSRVWNKAAICCIING